MWSWRTKLRRLLIRLPSKALQKEVAKDGELMLQLVIAEKLGKTLGELRETMTPQELLLWHVFYAERADREREAMNRRR